MDGTKQRDRVDYAFHIDNMVYSHRHCKFTSVYIAELGNISQSRNHPQSTLPNTHQHFLIVSESLASLTAISEPCTTHPFVQHILTLLAMLSSVGPNVIIFL